MPPDRSRFDVHNRSSLIAVSSQDGSTPVTLWADPNTHQLLTSGSGGGGGSGDGAILDGVNATIKATVFSLTNSKPLATQIVDANGTAITSFGGGTQYAEDAVHVSGDIGTLSLAVRNDGLATTLTNANGDYSGFAVSSTGALFIATTSLVPGVGATNLGKAEDAVHASGDTGIMSLAVRQDTPGNLSNANGDYEPLQVSAGRLWASTVLTDGTNTANVLKSDGTAIGQNALLSAPSYRQLTTTNITINGDDVLPVTDLANYPELSLQIAGTFSATLTVQYSNDTTTFTSGLQESTTSGSGTQVNTITAAGIFRILRKARYVRVRATAFTSNTSLTSSAYAFAIVSGPTSGTSATQTGTWIVGSNSATGAAVPANAFYLGLNGAGNLTGVAGAADNADGIAVSATASRLLAVTRPTLYNGTSWDLGRSILNATNSTGAGIAASGLLAQFDDVAPTTITENNFGNLRMSANRLLYDTIRDAAGNERGANVDPGNRLTVAQYATTSTNATVVGSATSVTLLAANTSRSSASIYNDSTAVLYVSLTATASTSSFKVVLAAGGYYEVPGGYRGVISGIWASATGNARVAEEV
jgi:hypothetical protein